MGWRAALTRALIRLTNDPCPRCGYHCRGECWPLPDELDRLTQPDSED